jgi:hypothetical protein
MAVDLKTVLLCDPCLKHGIPSVPAVATHTISIDGGPVKALEFCMRDEVDFEEFFRLYQEAGRVVEVPKKKEPKATRKRKPKAIEPPKEAEQLPIEDEAKQEPPTLICPKIHPSTGGPMRVKYSARGTHAKGVHEGAEVWDVLWEDPDGILTAFCREHAACRANNLGFTTGQGLKQHIYRQAEETARGGPQSE